MNSEDFPRISSKSPRTNPNAYVFLAAPSVQSLDSPEAEPMPKRSAWPRSSKWSKMKADTECSKNWRCNAFEICCKPLTTLARYRPCRQDGRCHVVMFTCFNGHSSNFLQEWFGMMRFFCPTSVWFFGWRIYIYIYQFIIIIVINYYYYIYTYACVYIYVCVCIYRHFLAP